MGPRARVVADDELALRAPADRSRPLVDHGLGVALLFARGRDARCCSARFQRMAAARALLHAGPRRARAESDAPARRPPLRKPWRSERPRCPHSRLVQLRRKRSADLAPLSLLDPLPRLASSRADDALPSPRSGPRLAPRE